MQNVLVKSGSSANTAHATAVGDANHPRSFKIAPDQKGPDVDLSDVQRSSGDSVAGPKGTSHFLFGIDKKSADGGYADLLTDFAAGFTRRCLQLGMTAGQFQTAVKHAAEMEPVAAELGCLSKCAAAVRADFEKAAGGVGSLVLPPLGWLGRMLYPARGLISKGRSAARATGNALESTLFHAGLKGRAVPRSLSPPGATPRGNTGSWNPFSGQVRNVGSLGQATPGKEYSRVGQSTRSLWNSPVGQMGRGALTGSAYFGVPLDIGAELMGWENHPSFSMMGAAAGAGARARLPLALARKLGLSGRSLSYQAMRGLGASHSAAKLPERLFTMSPMMRAKQVSDLRKGGHGIQAFAESSPLNTPLAMGFGIDMSKGRYALPGSIQRATLLGGTGLGAVGAAAKARGEEAGKRIVDENIKRFTGSESAEAFAGTPWGQFLQAYNSPEGGGLLPAIRAYWSALSPEAQQRLMLGGAALLGGGAMMGMGQKGLGLGMMAGGGLAAASGLGAFGAQPGSPEAIYSAAPEELRPSMTEIMNNPEFTALPQNDQSAILKQILAQQQAGGTELERARR